MPKLLAAALLCTAAFTSARAAPFDAAQLQTIPPIEIVRLALVRFTYIGVDQTTKDATLKEIGALDPKIQTLVWLSFIDSHLSEPSEIPVFYSWTGAFFPQMLQALEDAGMARRAVVFKTAWLHPKPLIPQMPMPDDFSNETAFRRIELGIRFGDKRAFEADLMAYVLADPTVSAWFEITHANLPDRVRLDALLAALVRIPESYKAEALATWPAPYRTLQLVALYVGELVNGGVEQFFANPSGDLAPATVPALRTIGLDAQAALVERGMGYFPQPYPTDHAARLQVLKAGADDDGESDVDRRLYALEPAQGALEAASRAMAAYARRENILPR